MNTAIITLHPTQDFNFWRTMYSHGWCSLLPFSVDKVRLALTRVLSLSDGSLVLCRISDPDDSSLKIEVHSHTPITSAQRREIKNQLAMCLRLSEDFSDFYRAARRYPRYRWIAKVKAGRMLRSPSLFEDIVKMICTTNCSWALTEIMIQNLVGKLGGVFDDTHNSFPSAATLAGVSESFLRKEIKAGYRSPFLLEFAGKVAGGKLDVEAWRSCDLSTDELSQQLRSIKGVGAYSAENLLKLLGRYDHLGLDSWSRAQYYSIYHHGRIVSDRTVERRYKDLGTWRGLFFWLEMTQHWYEHEFPF
jgi:3-methyladenine DNA glycosylase/8-oxoguanine DNA glycosylase